MKQFVTMLLVFGVTIGAVSQTKMFITKTTGTDTISLTDIKSISFKTYSSSLPNHGIVFISNRSGTDEVWFVNEDGSVLTQLTNGGPTSKMYPRWSPSGDEIAYTGLINGVRRIIIMKLDGSPLDTLITSAPVQIYGMCWSRDGSSIWYTEAISCSERIRKINVITNADSVIIDDNGIQQSPDEMNGTVAYRNGSCGPSCWINLYNISTGAKSQLPTLPDDATDQRWNHEGTALVFTATGNRISTINADGTSKNKITTCIGSYPDFTSTENIVFARNKDDATAATVFNIWTMDVNGGNLLQITSGDFKDLYPDAY